MKHLLELPPKLLSVGLVVVLRDARRFRLLCLRVFDSWDFPKIGEHGEPDALAAALAETRDATGIEDLELTWGEEYRETVVFGDQRVSRYYLAQTRTAAVALRIPPGRHSQDDYEYRWVTYEEAEDTLPPSLSLVLDWAANRIAAGPAR